MSFHRWIRFVLGIAGLGWFLGGCGFFPRMWDQPSVKPYEQGMPPMPANVVPVSGGDVIPPAETAATLTNPVPPSPPAQQVGEVYYGYFCQHCHGADGESRTPVGESYVPEPTPLASERVQQASDGELYRMMVVGRGHEPVLKATVSPEQRWYIVHFLRTLKP